MMMRAKLSTCALMLALSSPLFAADLPASGMSMQAVEKQFGAPVRKNAAVGQPPITRWEYNGFVVVFERSTVIQSVEVVGSPAAPAPAAKPAPAPVAAPAAAPAPVAAPAPKPAVDQAELERQAREREAMARARADQEAAAKAAEAQAKAAAEASKPAAVAPAPEAAPAPAPAEVAPAPTAAPAPAPVEEPKKPKGDGTYSFDPATGRIIIN